MDDDYGVIQEQGFVQGDGLGFKPLTEAEKEAIKKYNSNNPDKSKK